jgi:hypothetical protein
MRAAWLGVLAVVLVAGCAGADAAQKQTPLATVCANPYSGQTPTHVEIQLSVRDNDSTVTAHLCNWISVSLVGPPSSQWQSVQSSDDAILKVVPLPLHAPPPGGTDLVLEAERTGSAVLSSMGPSSACTSQTTACPNIRWAVTVNVVK